MSEYQYYEFRAIDRPLTVEQQRELRQLSTRAEISAHKFTNEYHFGDFKGNPPAMMRDYFDAFLYFANWGTHRLAFRLPADAIDRAVAEAYADGTQLAIKWTKSHVIVTFDVSDDGGRDWDEIEADLDDLLPVRNELLAGDLRPLYLGWLAHVQFGWFDDDEPLPEPPVPPGLGELTAAQEALAAFLFLNRDLVEVAATASPPRRAALPSQGLEEWLKQLPARDKERWLVRLASDDTPIARRELLRHYHAATTEVPEASASTRTSADLMRQAQQRAEVRRREEEAARAERKRREEEARRQQRKAHLEALAGRGEAPWRELEKLIGTKQPRSYDEAVQLLVDLHEVASMQGQEERYLTRLGNLRAKHARKPSLMERLNRAGLPG